MYGVDGEPVKFEWTIRRTHDVGTAPRDSDKDFKKSGIKPENFRDRITSMYNAIDWSKGENFKKFFRTLRKSGIAHTDSRRDVGLFLVQELKNGMEHTRTSLNVSGTDQQK